jgi:hypothetical protein
MNEAQTIPKEDTIDIRQLARAIRFALVAIVAAFSYLSVRSSLSIASFAQIYVEMLGPRPLPTLTQFILDARLLFVSVSILVPIAAVATLFLRRVVGSFYILGVLSIVTVAQFVTLYHGLSEPITLILSALTGTSELPAPPPRQ